MKNFLILLLTISFNIFSMQESLLTSTEKLTENCPVVTDPRDEVETSGQSEVDIVIERPRFHSDPLNLRLIQLEKRQETLEQQVNGQLLTSDLLSQQKYKTLEKKLRCSNCAIFSILVLAIFAISQIKLI